MRACRRRLIRPLRSRNWDAKSMTRLQISVHRFLKTVHGFRKRLNRFGKKLHHFIQMVKDLEKSLNRLEKTVHGLKGTSGNLIFTGEAFAGRNLEPLRGA